MEVTRKWWKRGGRRDAVDENGGVGEDADPVDTQEQEEMVRSFEAKHAQQSRLWRRVFSAFLLGYITFLIYSIYQQVWFPWELRFHAYFMEEMGSLAVILADWLAVLACLLAIKGLLVGAKSKQQWMWYSFYVGSVLAIFWFYYMLRLSKFRWDVLWLPLGPLGAVGISLYVDHLLLESLGDVRRLRNYMYNYKTL